MLLWRCLLVYLRLLSYRVLRIGTPGIPAASAAAALGVVEIAAVVVPARHDRFQRRRIGPD